MRAITSDEMKSLEGYAVQLGIPSRILMENAGMKVAFTALHEVKRAKSAAVICGNGGNGGDGFVAARYLHDAGVKTEVFLLQLETDIRSGDALANLSVLKKLNIPLTVLSSDDDLGKLRDSIMASDIVLDAIFGIGFKGEIKGNASKAIGLINDSRKKILDKRPYTVISVDIPSGTDASTGEAASTCVEADVTVTFEYPKIGLLKYPASRYAGKIITTGIGIPKPNPIEPEMPPAAAKPPVSGAKIEGIQVTDANFVSAIMPKRKVDSHKGTFGKVLVIAGSSGMMGAAVLTASAALRSGSGLVILCVPDSIKEFVNTMSLEVVVAGFKEIEENARECDVIAIGPGLSKGKDIDKLINSLLRSSNLKKALVLDADALNAITDPNILKSNGLDIVITPHPGEFARLAGKSVEEIQKDRMGYASRFAVDFGVTVVLKGAYTVIAGKDKQIYVNPVANPAMASAGVGDALTGLIASLIGQGMTGFDAAVAGTFIHGMAGNLSASLKGRQGLIASDIIESIPYTIESII